VIGIAFQFCNYSA